MSYTQKICLIIYFGLMLRFTDCSKKDTAQQSNIATADTIMKNQPALTGRLVYHSYSCYSCNDSKLYLFNFATHRLSNISSTWTIINPMNAHFSPDGKKIVFMGISSGSSNWDIYLWTVGSDIQPTNLTYQYGNTRDEDPKFSTDGNKIVFKQNGVMKEMDIAGNLLRSFSIPQSEGSMPYYTKDDTALIYSGNENTGSASDIYEYYMKDGSVKPLSAVPGVEEYYPIIRDDTSFLFTSWNNSSNKSDQVFLGFLNGHAPVRLPFNEPDADFSDAFPVSAKYVLLSSTRAGGMGQYDLYIADIVSGKIWSLNVYLKGINSAKNELGAAYSDK